MHSTVYHHTVHNYTIYRFHYDYRDIGPCREMLTVSELEQIVTSSFKTKSAPSTVEALWVFHRRYWCDYGQQKDNSRVLSGCCRVLINSGNTSCASNSNRWTFSYLLSCLLHYSVNYATKCAALNIRSVCHLLNNACILRYRCDNTKQRSWYRFLVSWQHYSSAAEQRYLWNTQCIRDGCNFVP